MDEGENERAAVGWGNRCASERERVIEKRMRERERENEKRETSSSYVEERRICRVEGAGGISCWRVAMRKMKKNTREYVQTKKNPKGNYAKLERGGKE